MSVLGSLDVAIAKMPTENAIVWEELDIAPQTSLTGCT